MSPSNINSFVGDLVQMAQAMEQLPKVQEELNNAQNEINRLIANVDGYKADLEQSRNYAASLEQKVRSLEVERDDASFRVLEAEDFQHTILQMAIDERTRMERLIILLDPPKPEPVKEPEPQVIAEPMSQDIPAQDVIKPSNDLDWKQDKADTSILPSGQSESPPTIHPEDAIAKDTSTYSTMDVKEVGATSTSDASTTEPSHGPYFDKRYMDVPQIMDIHTWLAGGGTEDDYYWRQFTPKVSDRSW